MPKEYLPLSLAEFLTDAAAAKSTPGGGSAAALAGALAAAMARMAANYTLAGKTPSEQQTKVATLERRLARSQEMLAQLMSEDMTAYEAYQAAARLDPADPQRTEQLRSASAACVAVPSEVITTCLASLTLMDEVKESIKSALLSDLGVAVELAEAAAAAAAWNLRANLASWPVPAEADSLRRDLEQWESRRRTLGNRIRQFLANQL